MTRGHRRGDVWSAWGGPFSTQAVAVAPFSLWFEERGVVPRPGMRERRVIEEHCSASKIPPPCCPGSLRLTQSLSVLSRPTVMDRGRGKHLLSPEDRGNSPSDPRRATTTHELVSLTACSAILRSTLSRVTPSLKSRVLPMRIAPVAYRVVSPLIETIKGANT